MSTSNHEFLEPHEGQYYRLSVSSIETSHQQFVVGLFHYQFHFNSSNFIGIHLKNRNDEFTILGLYNHELYYVPYINS